MKRILILFLSILIILPIYSATSDLLDADSYGINTILSQISSPKSPQIVGDYVVFTAASNARHTGIVFDFENFRTIHSFERLNTYDYDGKEVDSVLFYILKLPKNSNQISYRLIIDGLWTVDPNNTIKIYDDDIKTELSRVILNRKEEMITKVVESNTVKFIYSGESGQKIRVGGSFTNWDSYIYQLAEVTPGLYEIEIPLASGTYYYNFYKGINSFTDTKNPDKAYTPDGRVASVISIN